MVGAESPKEECGLFGVWAPGEEVARLAYFGLFAQQHRGQESAGIAVSDGQNVLVYKELGLVSQVFNEATLATLQGDLGIGHTRYSTTGSTTWENAQPVFKTDGVHTLALGHNGNLVNTAELAHRVGVNGAATTDTGAEDGLTLFTYPLLVDEGRLSERADELKAALAHPPFAEIHPDDAGNLIDGADVLLKTAAGEATLPARVTEHVAKGSVFVPFNQAGFQANRLLDGEFVTSVTVEPVAELVDAETGAEA